MKIKAGSYESDWKLKDLAPFAGFHYHVTRNGYDKDSIPLLNELILGSISASSLVAATAAADRIFTLGIY